MKGICIWRRMLDGITGVCSFSDDYEISHVWEFMIENFGMMDIRYPPVFIHNIDEETEERLMELFANQFGEEVMFEV